MIMKALVLLKNLWINKRLLIKKEYNWINYPNKF